MSDSAPSRARTWATRSAQPPNSELPTTASMVPPLVAQLGDLGAPTQAAQKDAEHIDAFSEEGLRDINVVAQYRAHFREDPLAFMQQIGAYAQGTGWRSYANYIGAPILYPGASEETIRAVLHSDQVKARISQLAERRVQTLLPSTFAGPSTKASRDLAIYKERKKQELEQQLTDVTRAILEKTAGRLDSLPFLKVFAATVNNILVRMYHAGIHINVPQVLELRRVAAVAAERKQSIIFLPCHKSHIDYLTISWLMFRLGIALPFIAAGENLDMPVVGDILRKGGAFFIRRTFGGDQLYPVVVKEYIETLLASGKNIECFIEGTRSRTGKLLPPKLGILSYILEGLLEGRTDDVWLCPISLQYDSVIESETYVSELLGRPKESETLLGLLTGSSSLLQLRMGRIDIRFQTPWSLKGFIKEQIERREVPGTDGVKPQFDVKGRREDRALVLKALGYRVLADINKVSVVMPAALVGTVILTLRGRGVGHSELIRRVEWLRGAIERKGYNVADFGQMSTSDVVDRALTLMKDLIGEHKDVMEVTYYPIKRFELSFYRNQVIHVFVSESLACAALYTRVKQGGTAPMQRMERKELLEQCSFISQVLRNEFVFGTDTLEGNVTATIEALAQENILQIDEGGFVGISAKEREIGRENYDSFLFLVWPFVEGYWLAAVSLLSLAPPPPEGVSSNTIPWFSAKDFEKRAQLFGKTLYSQGDLSYLEAINAATLAQAFTRYEERGMIIRTMSSDPKPIPLMALHPEWTPERTEAELLPSGKLWKFLEHLGSFRREGKNRRDNATVSTRVMRLASSNYPPVIERSTPKRDDGAKL